MDLQHRVVLVTGAGGARVGREIARQVGSRGAHVAVHYRTNRVGAELVCREVVEAGGVATPFQADLARAEDCRALVARVVKSLGHLDVLVNNASNFFKTPLDTTTEEQWDLTLDVNLKAPFVLSQAAAPHLAARGLGKIVNICDVQAWHPRKDWIPYCVSKAGLVSLTQALAKALAPSITVNAVAPGPVLMPPTAEQDDVDRAVARIPLGRIGTPGDVAAAVLFLLEGSDFVTGAIIPVDGGRTVG